VPDLPRLKADLSATVTQVALPGGKVRIVPGEGASRRLMILNDGELRFGEGRTAGVYIENQTTALVAAASSFAQLNRLSPSANTYDFFAGRKAAFEISEATLDVNGTLWELEYILNVPLVEDAEIKEGSRRLRIGRLLSARADGTAGPDARGRLVLQETLPALAVDERSRPDGLSEFYFLVTPSGSTRIMPDTTSAFVSSDVMVRTGFFPLSAQVLEPSAKPGTGLEPRRLVKVGLRRLGKFATEVPVTVEVQKP
jgi:hypothetical protein